MSGNSIAQISEILKDGLSWIHPENIVSIAIPKSPSGKIKLKLLDPDFRERIEVMCGETIVSLPSWPKHDHTIIESIQITENGLVFVVVVGKSPSQYGTEVIKAIVSRMIDRGMADFYAAIPEEASKTRCIVYSLDDCGGMTYKFTLMGVPNLRVINDELAIHTSVGEDAGKNEIRMMSLRDIKRGKCLSSDFMCASNSEIAFLGRLNARAKHPYVPVTFKDERILRLSLESLIQGRKGVFFESSNAKENTTFLTSATKVIGKLGFGLYGAVWNGCLVLTPKKIA